MAGIPPGTLRALRGYVSGVVGCSPARVTIVTRFDGGNRHAVYKVSFLTPRGATDHVVVRVSHGGSSEDCIQAEREAVVLKKVGGTAAPVLYDVCCVSEWFQTPSMCMQFIDGHQRDLGVSTPEQIEQVGAVVARLHCTSGEDLAAGAGEWNDLSTYAEARLQSILSTLVWARDPLPAAVQSRLRAAASSVQRSWEEEKDALGARDTGPLVLLHGDIATGNILWDPYPVLIDWEYARVGDPADEIAYLFDQNGLNPSQREAFWRGYLRPLDGSQSRSRQVADRLGRWEQLTLLGSVLWWVERWVRRAVAEAAGREDPAVFREIGYYSENVIRRLDRLDGLLIDP
jgi:thiamine kinase-like enzyme